MTGTLIRVRQVVKKNEEYVRILVVVEQRIRIDDIYENGDMLCCDYVTVEDYDDDPDDISLQANIRVLRQLYMKYLELSGQSESAGRTLIDDIDILNKESEQAHMFQIQEARDSWRARQRIRYPDGVTVEDVGIAHEGGYASFEIHNVTPNRPIMLLRRMDYARGDFEIEYSVNDVRVGISQCPGSDKRFRWRNWPYFIPAEYVTSEVLKITQKAVTAARDINMFHFWFYQAL